MKKKISVACILLLFVASCASKDTKNDTENYPTTDTTQKQTINDTISDQGAYGEGQDRNNTDK
jgi:hypothetical protein